MDGALYTIRTAERKGGAAVIVYDRLWTTMKRRGVSQYRLLKEHKFSAGQLDRLRKNENISTYTLNQLCKILRCPVEEIMEYVEEEENPPPPA
jgi:DNA-binding Xre family transcriptional regulator